MFSKILKKWTFPLILCAMMLPGAVGNLHAFSVDVSHLYYYDPSGPREIDYDFSAGTVGTGTPIPANNILLPDTNPPIVQKHSADLNFIFGNLPEVGVATVNLNTTAKVATVTTTGGAVVLQGSSPPPPPTPATTWSYAIGLKNFSGTTDPTKEYVFEVGFATPVGAIVQPQIRAFWTAAGNLKLEAVIFDEANDQDLWTSGVVDLGALTPASTAIELKMVNNGTTIVFSYRLNGGSETPLGTGTYTIASGLVFNSLPARFPYLYLEEGVPESPFRVSSQHWKDNMGTGNSYYDAWLTVEDPGQTTYSGITVTSSGAEQVLSGTALAYNPAGGYWEIPAQRFSDNFDDNTLDATKWTTQGSTVTETGGTLQVAQTVTNDIAKALSRDIVINPYAPIVVQRKAYVHAANQYFNGVLALYFGADADVSQASHTFSVMASHADYSYDDAETSPAQGFYIGKYAAHLTTEVTLATAAVWDNWFNEKISYNPVSGVADLYIDNVLKATYNVGALPANTTHMKVYLDAWGWNTGHYNYSDDLTVTQPWVGQPVRLISNSDTPPAGSVTFAFEATKKAGGTESLVKPVTGYVTNFATNLQPTGSVDTNPVFTWTGVSGASAYSVQVSDATGNRIWNKYDIPSTTTSYPYGGPALTNGQTYTYDIETDIETDGQRNSSFAQASFTYTGGGATPIAIPGTAAVGTDLSLTYTMHPPTGFTFATGVVASMSPETPGDFGITGYEGNEAPYSAYGFLNPTVTGIQDLGVTTLAAVTEIPNTGYTLPPALSLTAGHAYAFTLAGGYGVIAVKSVTLNLPSVTMVFDYKYWGSGAGTIAFNGWVNTVPDWPGTTNMAAVTGAQVSSYLAGTTVPIKTVIADPTTGAFSLTEIPKSQTFFIRVLPPTGYMPVLSKVMNWTADIQGLLPFVLFTNDQFSGFGNADNTSMIIGRVALTSETPPATTFLSGATITATQVVDGVPTATTYPVTYNSATGSTGADGIYMVKNVPSGTIVQLVATLAGHTFQFNGAYVPVAADAVSEESFFATATAPPTPSPFYSYSYHQPNGGDYFINLFAEDPTHAFTGGVTVSGPFLTGGMVSLAYNEVSKRWELPAGAGGMNLGSTPPTGGPFSYYFEAKIGAEVAKSETNVISVFVEGYATPSSPTGNVTEATPTFNWAAVSGATGYSIVLKDTTAGTDIWFTPILPSSQTNIVYNGTVPLVGGHAYEYTVIALNDSDGNQNSSFAPGSFTYAAACTYALNPALASPAAAGGSATVSVTAGAGCAWTAVSNNTEWLRVTGETSGSGNGTVDYTVDVNTGAARAGTITIAGQTFTVNQAAPEAPTATVSGIVRDLNGGVIASGVTVSLAGDSTKTASASTTDGSFSLPGLPVNTPFSLKFVATGYLDLYTVDFSVPGDKNISLDQFGGSGPINMLTAGELGAVGAMPASGKALILGRVSDMTYRYSSNVGGAEVTATSTLHPAVPYPVVYRSPFGVLTSASGTWGNGMFYVLNVDAGDTVTLTATRNGWTLPSQTFRTQADAVTLGWLLGTAGYDASLSGFVKTTAGAGVSGATVALKGDPGKFVTTSSDGYGSFVFGALPRDAAFKVKVTGGGFVDTYADARLYDSVTGVTYLMFTPGDLAMLGVTSNNGLLGGTIFDQTTMTPLAGATVALTSMKESSYTATYPGGSGSTSASGQFLVPNVLPGDVVKVEVTRAGYTFNAIYMDGFASSVTEAMLLGTAVSCTYGLAPTSASPAAAGGSDTVSVTAGAGCAWTAVSNNTEWLRVTGETSGSGNGTVDYTVDVNTGAARAGTITIAGQTFTVNQAAMSVEPHPEAATIESRFAEAIAWIKAGNFIGFAGYVSVNFLDYGQNKALFLAELQQETGALEYTIQSITGTGDNAVMNLTWSDGELDTLYFLKEGGSWVWYGNQHLFDAWANSSHEMYSTNSNPYWVNLSVEDPDPTYFPGLTIRSVTVTGTGLPAEGIPLFHDTTSGQWNSWMSEVAQPYLSWATTPAVPRSYTFNIAYEGTYPGRTSPEVHTYPVVAFVEVAPLQGSLSPASGSTAARPLVFSWDSNNFGPGYNYRVQVSDSGNNWIWESEESTTGTSLAYAGPFLPAGSYTYYLHTRDGYGNMSMIQVPFMMPPLKGDLNGDNKVDLADAVLALRILGGFSPTTGLRADYAASGTDVNGDNKAGLAELEFILQSAAGLRLQ